VDYFKYGQCRLAHSHYYCGPMSLAEPYKGLPNTEEADLHLGTDDRRPADNPKYNAEDYTQLQRAANPLYYAAAGTGKDNLRYWHREGDQAGPGPARDVPGGQNNGQRVSHPTVKVGDTVALFSNGEVHQAVAQDYRWSDAVASEAADSINYNHAEKSNYGMSLGGRIQYGHKANVHHAIGG